jgi:hypothetical protein
LHCINCHHTDDPGIIDKYTFAKIVGNIAYAYHEAKESLPILCPWFYSEPLMTQNLFEYLEYPSALGYKINLTTNGVIKDQWESLIKYKINYHLIVFSIDGLECKTYKAIRNHSIASVKKSLHELTSIISSNNLEVPICIKLTNKGIEWSEIIEFVKKYLDNPFVKMVSVSRAFDDTDGPLVARHTCRYLSEFFIIKNDLAISPCCMRWRAIKKGIGNVDIDNPMESFFSLERAKRINDLTNGDLHGYCLGCMSAYTGDTIDGTVDGKPFGKDVAIKTKQDFYNTFYFNPDYREAKV